MTMKYIAELPYAGYVAHAAGYRGADEPTCYLTRQSNRVYSHVVVWQWDGSPRWQASWCGSEVLASKQYSRLTKIDDIKAGSLHIIQAVVS